jgi:predicted transcriptional regulator
MNPAKWSVPGRMPIFILVAACVFLLIAPASAYSPAYSIHPWSDNPPGSEAKLPVPVGIWQVPPLTVLLAFTAIFLPFCLVPVEILVSCAGFVVMNFRRVRKNGVLGNDCRAQIYRHIVLYPGAGFTEIMRDLPVNRGTLFYHLTVLCRERLVVAFSVVGKTCYFQNAGKFSDPEKNAIARLRNSAGLPICEFLVSCPNASRRDIALRLKTTCSTVSWHMQRLCAAGLATSIRESRNVRYALTPVAVKVIGDLREAAGGAGTDSPELRQVSP